MALGATAVASAAAHASEPAISVLPENAPFEMRLQAALREIEAQNLSVIVGVSHDGEGVQLSEFGVLASDDIAPEATQIDINSITKTVTGVMIAKLVEQGHLRFDERLDEIFSDVPPDKAGVTVHQLLTHSAGFPESMGDDSERLGRAAFLNRVWATDLQSPPGEVYGYSNTGYGLLAAILEERSGESYETYLREEVLPGGRFPNTGYEAGYDPLKSARTHGGSSIRDASWGGHQPYWNLIGNGGLVSSVPEMIAFLTTFNGGELVDPELAETVRQPHIREGQDAESFYGYGVVVQEAPAVGRFYWHDGGNDVFSAHWADFPHMTDVLFTAGLEEDAFTAMGILAHYLFDIGDYGP